MAACIPTLKPLLDSSRHPWTRQGWRPKVNNAPVRRTNEDVYRLQKPVERDNLPIPMSLLSISDDQIEGTGRRHDEAGLERRDSGQIETAGGDKRVRDLSTESIHDGGTRTWPASSQVHEGHAICDQV
ncbi:hypothetical protein MMC28_010500 [Mycoblastus sanguinarius]|nr:hypothetical protein [Mycoblastus sanguinarius]